jgi:TrmH family RNA methyltransferase
LRKTTSDQPLISSPENEVVRRLRRLARRREPGFALLEGPRVVAEAAAAGVPIELLVLRAGDGFEVAAERTVTFSRGLFAEVAHTETPQGVIAIARAAESSPKDAIAAARATRWPLVVLDRVQDPGNVGAISRTAAAAGAPALVVLPGTADPFGEKAVRASAGNVFRLVVARAEWRDLSGIDGYGAAAKGGQRLEAAAIENAGMIVLGSEAHGLSRTDLPLVTIPSGIESLNVAAAAAVLLFEIQRRKAA